MNCVVATAILMRIQQIVHEAPIQPSLDCDHGNQIPQQCIYSLISRISTSLFL